MHIYISSLKGDFPQQIKSLGKTKTQTADLSIIISSASRRLKEKNINHLQIQGNIIWNTHVNRWIHLRWPEADRIAINDAQRTIEVHGENGRNIGGMGQLDTNHRHFHILTRWEEKHQSDAFVNSTGKPILMFLSLPLRRRRVAGIAREAPSFRGTTARATQVTTRWDPEILEFDNHGIRRIKYIQISKSKGIW